MVCVVVFTDFRKRKSWNCLDFDSFLMKNLGNPSRVTPKNIRFPAKTLETMEIWALSHLRIYKFPDNIQIYCKNIQLPGGRFSSFCKEYTNSAERKSTKSSKNIRFSHGIMKYLSENVRIWKGSSAFPWYNQEYTIPQTTFQFCAMI